MNNVVKEVVTSKDVKANQVFLLTLDIDNNFKLDMDTVDKISTFEFFHVHKIFDEDQVTRVDIYGLFNKRNIAVAKIRLEALLHNLKSFNPKAINTVAFFKDILDNILFKTEVNLKDLEISGLNYLQDKGLMIYKSIGNDLAVYFIQNINTQEAENIKHSLFIHVNEEVYIRVLYHLQAA